jgi:hypothetical protein
MAYFWYNGPTTERKEESLSKDKRRRSDSEEEISDPSPYLDAKPVDLSMPRLKSP